MSSEARQESPLTGIMEALGSFTGPTGADAPFRLRDRPFRELVSVRGDIRSPRLGSAIQQVLGFELPAIPNTVKAGVTYTALWLGPDEWLLVSSEQRKPSLERTLRPLLTGQFAAAVDVSSGFAVLEVSGSQARAALQKGCPLDLHPRVFCVGQCAQSHFFKAGIVLRPVSIDAYELLVRRSFAEYTARMLLDAADG